MKKRRCILLVSTVVPWWDQETSGSPGVPSSRTWTPSQLPCTRRSTGSSSRRSGSICWGCRFEVQGNSQPRPPPRCGCRGLPLGSGRCRHNLKDVFCGSLNKNTRYHMQTLKGWWVPIVSHPDTHGVYVIISYMSSLRKHLLIFFFPVSHLVLLWYQNNDFGMTAAQMSSIQVLQQHHGKSLKLHPSIL